MKYNNTPVCILHLIIVFFLTSVSSKSQQVVEKEILSGRHFMFSIPHCAKEAGEGARGSASVELWVSSEKNTTVYVSTKSHGSFQAKINADKVAKIPLNDSYMNTKNEIIQNLGIELTSNEPVSVTVYISYRYSGEAFKVIPSHSLGTRYRTLNLYQDETDEIKPSQIVIVAAEDTTTVKYTPTFNTANVQKGKTGTIVLNKGQSFLIHNEKKANYTHIGGDLTGSLIESDKPIAVISGHTKGAFPRYSKRMLGRPANFMRNTLVEMMLPENMLGTEYISAPIKYTNRYVRNIDPDDVGDMIRFVATVNGTIISQMRQDGTGLKPISKLLNAGEYHEITNMDLAALYKSNFPVLVGQYGKAWRNQFITSEAKKEEIQNPSRNGSGMLLTLTPFDRWYSHTSFYSQSGIDNFVYMTFHTKDSALILLDDSVICKKYKNDIVQIMGTPYSYLATQVSYGEHIIRGAKFAAYAYGNWDYSKDGFAYGYPTALMYNKVCNDSLIITSIDSCGTIVGKVSIVNDSAHCSSLYSISLVQDSIFNFSFTEEKIDNHDLSANFTLKIIDKLKAASALIEFTTTAGTTYKKRFTLPNGCYDSISFVTNASSCGEYNTQVQLLSEDTVSSRIDIIGFNGKNYEYTEISKSEKSAQYVLNVTNKDEAAFATVKVLTKRGISSEKGYSYKPSKLPVIHDTMRIGILSQGEIKCAQTYIYNRTNEEIIIQDIKFSGTDHVFHLKTPSKLPFIFLPDKPLFLKICGENIVNSQGVVSSSIEFSYPCGKQTIGYVSFDSDSITSHIQEYSVTNNHRQGYYSVHNVVYDGTKLPNEFDILQQTSSSFSLYDNIGQRISTGIITSKDDLLSQSGFTFPKGVSILLVETKGANGQKYMFRVCHY